MGDRSRLELQAMHLSHLFDLFSAGVQKICFSLVRGGVHFENVGINIGLE